MRAKRMTWPGLLFVAGLLLGCVAGGGGQEARAEGKVQYKVIAAGDFNQAGIEVLLNEMASEGFVYVENISATNYLVFRHD